MDLMKHGGGGGNIWFDETWGGNIWFDETWGGVLYVLMRRGGGGGAATVLSTYHDLTIIIICFFSLIIFSGHQTTFEVCIAVQCNLHIPAC